MSAKVCECEQCELYYEEYEYIANCYHPKWITISPPYTECADDDFFELYMTKFEEFRFCVNEAIIVMEMSPQYRLHWHIFLNVTDPIKFRRIINSLQVTNMVRVYDGEPKEGQHYLSKDLMLTYKHTNINPIYFLLDLEQRVVKRKLKLKQQRLESKTKKQSNPDIEIPDWMRGIHKN